MTFFESLIVLLAIAILLLQVSRRLSAPYPAMLAGAGVLLAFVPGTPTIELDPHTALALFIAPVLVDAAYDFPISAVRRYWRQLFVLAVMAVLLTAGAITWLGVAVMRLPVFAALALGAIVAPPDAAAATAILRSVAMPRRSVVVLKGESLLNDATALLLFTTAVSVQSLGHVTSEVAAHIAFAAPGGILFGILAAWMVRYATPYFTGTLSGTLLEFVTSFGVWIIAERAGLSAVLALVAFAMTVAIFANTAVSPRVRLHSFAVWDTVVFLLNVFAFLLMGLQVRSIVGDMSAERLNEAAWFAAAVLFCVISVRMIWLIAYNRLAFRYRALRGNLPPASFPQGILIGWCGMRGLVTLAAAYALPADFPRRETLVLTAFAVVLGTLVFQGLTLTGLVRLLRLDGEDGFASELATARTSLAATGLTSVGGEEGRIADHWRRVFELNGTVSSDLGEGDLRSDNRRIGLKAIASQRMKLDQMVRDEEIGPDTFAVLQRELDFAEVAADGGSHNHIEET